MKLKTIFLCSDCGNEAINWSGQCPSCGAWNTLKEFSIPKKKIGTEKMTSHQPINLATVKIGESSRTTTGIREVDRVLGGGIVKGSVILVAGDPGIGKSTLLLQIASRIKQKALYLSGEESEQQIKMRLSRLDSKKNNLDFLGETEISFIEQAIESAGYELVIIDSIQTIYDSSFPATAGSLTQIRECTLKFLQLAKGKNISFILIGHVTKEGILAGPRLLEHMVDVVCYLEGERYREIRILRGIKNRFGATDEIGIFIMKKEGLVEVENPSAVMLRERQQDASGSTVSAIIEGTRPLLIEVQALVAPTNFPYPRRTGNGFDFNRLQLIIAVLEKRAHLNLVNSDVYINIVGGVKIKEPASDLAVALAIASALKNKPLKKKLCVFGELGLAGEIRSVNFSERRISEAKRLGFTDFVSAKNLIEAIKEAME